MKVGLRTWVIGPDGSASIELWVDPEQDQELHHVALQIDAEGPPRLYLDGTTITPNGGSAT